MTGRVYSPLSLHRFIHDLLPFLVLAICTDSSFVYLFLVVLQTHLPDQPGGSVALPGYALAAFGTTKLLVQVGTGFLSDRLGRRQVLTLGFALDIFAVLFLLLSHRPLLAIPFGALYGFGNAAIWPALEAEMVGRFEEKERGRAAALMLLSVAGATVLGLGGGALIIEYLRFQTALLVALIGLGSGFLLAVVWSARWPTGDLLLSSRKPALPQLPVVLGERRRLLFALLITAYTAGLGVLLPAFRPYATEVLQLPLRTFVLYLAPAGIVGGLVTLGGGLLSDRWGRYPILVGGLISIELGLGVLMTTRSPLHAALIACLIAAGLALTVPGLGAGSMDLAGDQYRGAVLGFFMMAEGLGQSFGPALGGYAVAVGGAHFSLQLAVALHALALVVVGVLGLQTGFKLGAQSVVVPERKLRRPSDTG